MGTRWIGVLGALALAGCGGTPAGTLSGSDAARLHASVDAVRTAIAAGDGGAATIALDRLQQQVDVTRGLPAADARTLKTGISRLRRRIAAPAPTPTPTPTPAAATPTPTPTPKPPPAPPPPGKGKDHKTPKGGEGD
ncbi:MAG: hypothetical protein QOE28_1049 [Solirubrobacteraceae bacterium]|nr:hypothetical protein [Solirubrobacteraceae bacterium]